MNDSTPLINNANQHKSKLQDKLFVVLAFAAPFVMSISGFLYFVPRNPQFYWLEKTNELNSASIAVSFFIWYIISTSTVLLAKWFSIPVNEEDQAHFVNLDPDLNLPWYLKRCCSRLNGVLGVIVFFVVGAGFFLYFETRFADWHLMNSYEVWEYPLSLIPFFSLAYLARDAIRSWRLYAFTWIVWGICWDTCIPGFVYVPNFGTWHQWMLSPCVARFCVDGLLS